LQQRLQPFEAMAKYILAIDQGTTSTRAVLFDKQGQKKGQEQMEFTQHYPQAGWTEHDPNEILSTVVKCCEGVVSKAGASTADIAAIGITNQRETTVAWDRKTGEPLCNAIVWLDLRTSETVEKLVNKMGSKDGFRAKTGLPISTYFSAVKMAWMLDKVPEVKAAADEGRCMFGTIECWLIYKLTGGADGGEHITDISNASRYMLMNLEKQAWDEETCKTLGIPMDTLPKIVSNSEVYGKVKGFDNLSGIAISGSLGDQHAALLGQGCLEVGSSKNTYGTGCFMLLNTGEKAIPSESGLLTTIGYKLGPDSAVTYALEGSVACAGRTIQWLRDNVGIIKDAAETEALATSVEDTGGVTLVPAFSGLFAPHWRTDARAVLVGMTLYSRREHICRAALESVAFSTVDVMDAMKKDSKMKLGKMHVDGGMTQNNFLMQLQSDLLGVEVLRAKMPEATVLGAALAAGLAVGFYANAQDVKEFLSVAGGHESFEPKMSAKTRTLEHGRWTDALKRSHGLAK
jgi:glycerol kinase